ncbi:MAG: SH3 domain-containing protein [Chitinivibrionales bacterium]|nr:SH3 domain-containing protein [Chitinivibrionales bacterium]
MRLMCSICLLMVTLYTFTYSAGAKFVQPKSSGVSVYAKENRDQAIAEVGVDDRLQVLSSSKDLYKIKTPSGTVGWVEKKLVAEASGKAYMFDDAEVVGYLDNPTPVYIIDADNKEGVPIKLERSFADALKENVDRETLARQK